LPHFGSRGERLATGKLMSFLPQIFAMMSPPLLALIVVQVTTFNLDHNKILLELGTIECLSLESQA